MLTLERTTPPKSSASAAPELLERIQNEYLEMPGLILTEAQARRLWAIDVETCRGVLDALLRQRFLKRTASGAYVRAAA